MRKAEPLTSLERLLRRDDCTNPNKEEGNEYVYSGGGITGRRIQELGRETLPNDILFVTNPTRTALGLNHVPKEGTWGRLLERKQRWQHVTKPN
jgi:hypothetical protein